MMIVVYWKQLTNSSKLYQTANIAWREWKETALGLDTVRWWSKVDREVGQQARRDQTESWDSWSVMPPNLKAVQYPHIYILYVLKEKSYMVTDIWHLFFRPMSVYAYHSHPKEWTDFTHMKWVKCAYSTKGCLMN